jgi:hypothetical protein
MMTVAALTGDGCPIEGFHQEKGRSVIKSKIWSVDTDKYGLSFMMALDIEKPIQQILKQGEIYRRYRYLVVILKRSKNIK